MEQSNSNENPEIDYSLPVSFSEIPPALQNLMKEMVSRVYEKVDSDDAEQMCWPLEDFMAGNRKASPNTLSKEMAVLLRALI